MEAIVALIVSYCSMWMPALTAIVGVVVLLVTAYAKMTRAVKGSQDAITQVKDDTSFKELSQQIKDQQELDRQVIRAHSAVIDRITKIEDYMAAKEREENGQK